MAVAGIVDLNGEPRNAMADFVRFLEKQNMVVDAIIDLHTLEVRGKINVQTDYLIMGGGGGYPGRIELGGQPEEPG